ncbi:hypothetical protein ACNQT2_11625, partial [Corynebacterium diphtheriae]
ATYDNLHMALLTGLLGNIGFKGEDEPGAGYLGARGIKFHIWPGSSLLKKPGKWIMAAELATRRGCTRACVAQDPARVAGKSRASSLLKKSVGAATYDNLHMALLTGLLGNIGFKGEDEPGAGYLG